jgi:hypothetical protein
MSRFLQVIGVVALILAILWFVAPAPPPVNVKEMPWAIEKLSDGSIQVMGIRLGKTTLKEITARYGDLTALGLFGGEKETDPMSLEAYFDQVRNGPLAAKMVFNLKVDRTTMAALRGRAIDRSPGPSGDYQWTLHPDDVPAQMERPVVAITYIPTYGSLDEAFFISRFGEPASKTPVGEGEVRWEYPDKGLTISILAKGKEVLQYRLPVSATP